MKKKTFDAVAFMRKRREELSRAYTGLNTEQIKEQIHQTLKDNPQWAQYFKKQAMSSSINKIDCPYLSSNPEWI